MKGDQPADLSSQSILAAMAAHREALDAIRYGSFRGIVRDGRLVRFAIEQEWRPADTDGKEVV